MMLSAGYTQVTFKHMWKVLTAISVKELCLGLPVQPTDIEGTVRITDDAAPCSASPQQEVTRVLQHVASPFLANSGVTPRDFLVRQQWIEIGSDPFAQTVVVDINQELITTRLDSRKANREKVRQ
jgi:hypothetical protein